MAHLGCTIGIDIGTSSVKAIAFDANMQEIAHAAEKVESWHDDAGAAEQDPMVVYYDVASAERLHQSSYHGPHPTV
jgi:sugar (pentulose or hexulose) kinase